MQKNDIFSEYTKLKWCWTQINWLERSAPKHNKRGSLPHWNTMEQNPVGQWAFCCSLEFLLLPYSSSVSRGFCCNTRDIFIQTNTQRINGEKQTLKLGRVMQIIDTTLMYMSETGTKPARVQHEAPRNVNYRTTYNIKKHYTSRQNTGKIH